MAASIAQIKTITTIRRERVLPYPGRIQVRKGQKVGPRDIVSECRTYQNYYLVNVSQVLGIPAHRVGKLIQCQVGSQIKAGDVIAGPAGFLKRVIRSSKSGMVVFVGRGLVLVELDEAPLVCVAGYPGEVVELLDDRGVIVQTTGSLIQGVWGNGQVGSGLLKVLAEGSEHMLEGSQLLNVQAGEVLTAGYCRDEKVFESLEKISIGGLILSSMSNSLKRLVDQLTFPVILLEGFGQSPINPFVFELLKSNEEKLVSINAEKPRALNDFPPEIIIPIEGLDTLQEMDLPASFAEGQRVRIMDSMYARQTGLLTKLCGFSSFPSGVRATAAEVKLDANAEKVIIPLINLEILV